MRDRVTRELLAACRAALADGEALAGWLERLTGVLEVERLAWPAAEGGSAPGGASGGRRLRVDPALWRDLRPGEVRRVAPERARRSARLELAEGREVTLCRPSVGGGAVLWIESRGALCATDETVRAAAEATALVAELCESAAARTAERRLARRGATALAMVHDLGHELSVATLLARRALDEDGEPRELERALARAGAIARDALAPAERRLVEDVALRELLRGEAETVSRLGASEPVTIALRCAAGLRVRAVRTDLARVVRNLVLNACRATAAGGRVLVSAAERGDVVEVRVEDSGRGMEAAEVERLFTSDRTDSGGAGCGTLSVLACVENLGAALEVESEPGCGTHVRLELPASGTPGEPLDVLVVDDLAARAATRARALGRGGARVGTAGDAHAALDRLEREAPRRLVVARGLPDGDVARLALRARELGVELELLAFGEPVQPA